MDVNEMIIEEWARVCKEQFTIADVKFSVIGPGGGTNYSNIDLLAYDPRNDSFFDYEVKWRATEWVGATKSEKPENLVGQMIRPERQERIKRLIGESNYPKLKRVFITPKKWLQSPNGQSLVALLAQAQIDLKYFEDVISELQAAVKARGRYDSVVSQLVRMIGLCSSEA